MSLQLAVIMVPVIFGFMGFALDLGRLYLIKGELNQAASAMALAAAQQLNGTSNALANATTAASQSLDNTNGTANKYNFGSLVIGQTTGNLSSTINPTAYFATADDAVGTGAGGQVDGTLAHYAQITLQADAPLLFWSLLPVGQSRKTSVGAIATAGLSAPLCTGCGIPPIAIPALNTGDPVDFGFDSTNSTVYTLYYTCSGTPVPAPLAGAAVPIPYVLFNRYDTASALSETDQLFQYSAQGLPFSADPTPNTCTTSPTPAPLACVNVMDCEQFWASAPSRTCTSAAVSTSLEAALCGLYSRLDFPSNVTACTTVVTDFAALATPYLPDTDLVPSETPPYLNYTGNGRRLITAAIVDGAGATMTVLGFRQFLIEPNLDGTFFNPADPAGRFPALYIGSPAPMQQGWFDSRYAPFCPIGSFSGPGKVVLHQ
jgi:Flp pilus assembly protein TadG